jgi:nucleotide-binding universal stress UspA family protein
MFEKILVPLDRSKLAEQVFPSVTDLAGAFGSEVVLLGVCDGRDKDDERLCRLYMESEASQLRTRLMSTSAVLTTRVLSGQAAEQILRHAEAERFDLVIMSSHGQSGITRWSLGSTADRVVRKVGVPVIVVRSDGEGLGSTIFRRVLVPLDGSERSAAVLPLIKQVASRLPCEVFLVEVIEPGTHVRTIGGMDYVAFKERNTSGARAAGEKYLDKIVATDLSSAKARVSHDVLEGDAARKILDYADEKGCTLIAMSTHGHSGIELWSMGSVASKVSDASRHSVWLVPSFSRR